MRFYFSVLVCLLALLSPVSGAEEFNLQKFIAPFSTNAQPNLYSEPVKAEKTSVDILDSISIVGNKHVPTKLILREVVVEPGDEVSTFTMSRIVKNIRNLGSFSDVDAKLAPSKNRGRKVLVITVRENQMVSSVQFVGNTVYKSTELEKLVSTKAKDILSLEKMRKDIQLIEEKYRSAGYNYAKVYSVNPPESTEGPMVFFIGEGVLEEIVITGNSRTKRHVILREMDLKPGMPIREEVLRSDVRKIYNLNYFTELEPDLVPGKTPSGYVLQLKIKDKSPGSLNVGGGYSATSRFFLFTDVQADNVFGTGQLLALKGQFGSTNTSYEFKYFNPWMWSNRKSFMFRVWNRTGQLDLFGNAETISSFRNQTSTGGDMTFGLPISYSLRTWHKFRLEKLRDNSFTPAKNFSVQSYAFTIADDTRDVWFNPLKGHYYSFGVEKGFSLRDTSLDFEQYDIALKKFFPTFDKQTIGTRLEIGILEGRSQTDLVDSVGYIVGSQNTVRGYVTPFAKGARRVITSVEYRISFNQIFQGVLFVDAGTASQSLDDSGTVVTGTHSVTDLTHYKIGKGFGVRITTPMGPLRLDLGNNDKGNWNLHFNIGNSF